MLGNELRAAEVPFSLLWELRAILSAESLGHTMGKVAPLGERVLISGLSPTDRKRHDIEADAMENSKFEIRISKCNAAMPRCCDVIPNSEFRIPNS